MIKLIINYMEVVIPRLIVVVVVVKKKIKIKIKRVKRMIKVFSQVHN
jgi:hypothetical protein